MSDHAQDELDRRVRAYVDDNLVAPTPRDYLYALNLVLIGMNLALEEEAAKVRGETEAIRARP